MARIKTEKYDFGGEEIQVNYNCSTSGIFSTNLNSTIQEKLGLKGRMEASSLSELEDTISKAFIAYKESRTSYRLLIAIYFGASGAFTFLEDGSFNSKFGSSSGIGDKYTLLTSMTQVHSAIGLDFEVLIEENRDGRIIHYKTWPLSDNRLSRRSSIEVGGYGSCGQAYLGRHYDIIEYSEQALCNLESIKSQLRKASNFLIELISNDNLGLLLSGSSLKSLV